MQGNAGVGANALLSSTKSSEILSGFGDYIIVEFDDDPPFQLISDGNVQKTARPATHGCSPSSLTVHVDCVSFQCIYVCVRIGEQKKNLEESN